MKDWEAQLKGLPDPVAPATAMAAIMVRVRTIEPTAGAASTARSRQPAEGPRIDWRPWAIAAGVTAVAGAHLPWLFAGEYLDALLSLRLIGWLDGPAGVLNSAPVSLVVGAGLAAYVLAMVPSHGDNPPEEN